MCMYVCIIYVYIHLVFEDVGSEHDISLTLKN